MTGTSNISVIICTYNRSAVLANTLDSFAAMDLPGSDQFELVIVDNNSNDNTAEIAQAFSRLHPYSRYLFEPRPGLSHARNKGILDSLGKVIVFIDDDVFLDKGWLNAVTRTFAEQPGAAAFGGKSVPQFEAGRPPWLPDELLTIYGDTRLGDVPRWMIPPEQPFGLNMAFRRETLEKIGFFNPLLGRIGTKLLSNEEKDFFQRIASAGLKTWYEPSALLFHRIPESRTRPEWVISRSYWQGVSDAVFEQGVHPRSRATLFAAGIHEIWRAVSAMRGRRLSPIKIRWHYSAIPIAHKAHYWEELGRGWHRIRMAFLLSKASSYHAGKKNS